MKYKYLIALLFLFAYLKAQPITGEAKKLEFEKNRIIYSGDVKLTRGESVLRADKVIILLNEESKPIKLIATGNVLYTEPGRKATADYAEYDLGKELILLKGSARVEDERNLLEAEEIVYDRAKGTLRARSEKERVRTLYIEEPQK